MSPETPEIPKPEPHTSPRVIFTIVIALVGFSFLGLVGTITLIILKSEQASVALISTMTGTCLGYLSSLLSSTRTLQNPQAPVAQVAPVVKV